MKRIVFDRIRENGREYLTTQTGEKKREYTENMIIRNDIAGLLPLQLRNINGKSLYYYDITGRVAFGEMFFGENDILDANDMERLNKSLSVLLKSVGEYMLDIDDINMSPDYIFYNAAKASYEFLYVPAEEGIKQKENDFREAIKLFWENILKKLDRSMAAKDLMHIYEIYQKLCAGSFEAEKVFDTDYCNYDEDKQPPTQEIQKEDALRAENANSWKKSFYENTQETLKEEYKENKNLFEDDLFEDEDGNNKDDKKSFKDLLPANMKKYVLFAAVAAALILCVVVK